MDQEQQPKSHIAGEFSRQNHAEAATSEISAEAESVFRFASILLQKGLVSEAEEQFRLVLTAVPGHAGAHHELGLLHLCNGDGETARLHFQQALASDPSLHEAHYQYATLLATQGKGADAELHYRKALEIEPRFPQALNNLAVLLRGQGKVSEAATLLRQAIELVPAYTEASVNLALILRQAHQSAAAEMTLRDALRHEPAHPRLLYNLGSMLFSQGMPSEAASCFRQANLQDPALFDAGVNFLSTLNYLPDWSPIDILNAHRTFFRQEFGHEPVSKIFQNDPSPRRLKIGYVSPDFRQHSISYFLQPLLKCHDRNSFEIYCYASVATPDRMTESLSTLVDVWRNIADVSDPDADKLIRSDRIDILIDLAGLTSGNRIRLLARKPAPVQVTWLGYPCTTGLEAIDYRLTDEYADPTGLTDRYYSEKLVRLPAFLCYSPPEASPAISPLPADMAGAITFASFNNMAKITDETLILWKELLLMLPQARLILKGKGLTDSVVREKTGRRLRTLGLDVERVLLAGWTDDTFSHLNCYNDVDIALDTFPYNGTTTTCEALWMGVPVITLEGGHHAARVSSSILRHAGLPELIAKTPQQYLQTAVRLAEGKKQLRELRLSLRQRLQNSPLLDGARFASEFEKELRKMWGKWCSTVGNS